MGNAHQYGRCLVLGGGGFRFGYYLGIHAAAEDAGQAPDILLATCGGAIAAAAIARLPDARARHAWLASREVYDFVCGLRSTAHAAPARLLHGAARRWLRRTPVPTVPDLFGDYLFDVPARLPLPARSAQDTVAVAIVGGRLLFRREQVGHRRGDRALFAETVFCNERTAALLEGMAAPAADPRWSAGAVMHALQAETAVPLEDAVRISLADMVYFRCHGHAGSHYTGGVIDLFPIELAHRLAGHVAIERKQALDRWLVAPAWRAVLGIDGAARLRHVHAAHANVWIDTSDAGQALRAHGTGKRIRWRENRLRLVPAPSFDAYQAQVDAQWRYGYRQAQVAYEQGSARCAS